MILDQFRAPGGAQAESHDPGSVMVRNVAGGAAEGKVKICMRLDNRAYRA
jgi:hypothetical protein